MTPTDYFIENDHRYISAALAARAVGYTNDYVGQLARAQKIPGRLVGRTWYVDLEKLHEYKRVANGDQRPTTNDLRPLRTYHGDLKELGFEERKQEKEQFFNKLREAWEKEEITPTVFLPAEEAAKRGASEFAELKKDVPKWLAEKSQTLNTDSQGLALVSVNAEPAEKGKTLSIGSQGLALRSIFSALATLSLLIWLSPLLASFSPGFAKMAELSETALVRAERVAENVKNGARELYGIAFPRTKSASVKRTANLTTGPSPIQVEREEQQDNLSLAASQPFFDLEAIKRELRSELTDFIRVRTSSSPVVIYSSPSVSVEKEVVREIVVERVTRQSDSDSSRLSSVISAFSDGGSLTNNSITNASISGSSSFSGTSVTGSLGTFANLLLSSSSTLQNFTFTNATGTSATTTSIYISGNASTTNLFANTGTIGSLTSGLGTFTNLLLNGSSTLQNLTFINATGTSATTTNFFSTTASSTNLYSTAAAIGALTGVTGEMGTLLVTSSSTLQNFTALNSTTTNATTTALNISGTGAGLTFSGTGNHDITATAGTLRIGANTIIGNILPLDNTIDIGAAGQRFDKIYADEVNASNIVGTIVGGNVSAETLRINSDNATADAEDSFVEFERGSEATNALLRWDSANDRFTFNSDLHLVSGVGSGNFLVNGSTTLQNLTFINATGTSATTTNFYATTASSTNLFTSLLTVNGFGLTVNGAPTLNNWFDQSVKTTAAPTFATLDTGQGANELYDMDQNVLTTSNVRFAELLATGSSTLQSFTFINATGTSATTTNFFATTASSTNLFTSALTVNGFGLTVNGAPTLNNWFDQSVKTTAAPTFATLDTGQGANELYDMDQNVLTTSNVRFAELLATGSSTLQSFTFINATGTSATTTNFAISGITSSLLKTNGSGSLLAAVAGTDYENPLTFSTGLSRSVNTITVDQTFSPTWTGAHIFNNITRSTTTSATTTSLFSTTASSTNLFSSLLTVGGTALVVDSSGNVGIGDSTPASLFTVGNSDLFQINSSGYALLPAGAVGTPSLSFVGDTNNGIWSAGADIMNFSTAGAERLRITSGGFLGVGTSTPYSKFSVWGSGTGSSRLFEVTNNASTTLFMIEEDGTIEMGVATAGHVIIDTSATGDIVRLGIGTTTPDADVSIVSNQTVNNTYLFTIATTTGNVINRRFTIDSDGDIAYDGTATTPADYAEAFTVVGAKSGYEPGDIVVLSTTEPGKVEKTASPYQKNLVGVYSTKPGIVGTLAKDITNYKIENSNDIPVGLLGRVPVKVTAQNGAIKVGDRITSSSIPGVGMKATSSGMVVGTALEDYNPSNSKSVGKIMLLLDSSWFFGNALSEEVVNLDKVSPGVTFDDTVILNGGLRVDRVASVGDILAIESDIEFIGRPYFNSDTGGIAVVKKGDRKVEVAFDKPYIDAPVVSATISFSASSTDTEIENILSKKPSYVVTNRSGSGFSVLLSEAAPEDISFSWIALAIKNIKISSSENTSQPGVPSTVIDNTTSTNDSFSTDSTSLTASSPESTASSTATTTESATTDTTASSTPETDLTQPSPSQGEGGATATSAPTSSESGQADTTTAADVESSGEPTEETTTEPEPESAPTTEPAPEPAT